MVCLCLHWFGEPGDLLCGFFPGTSCCRTVEACAFAGRDHPFARPALRSSVAWQFCRNQRVGEPDVEVDRACGGSGVHRGGSSEQEGHLRLGGEHVVTGDRLQAQA